MIRVLDERLGVWVLTRTTRSVTRTEAGEHLLRDIAPLLEQIDSHLGALTEFGQHPLGGGAYHR